MSVLDDKLDLNVVSHIVDHHAADLPPELIQVLLQHLHAIQNQEPDAVVQLVEQFRQNPVLDDLYLRSLQDLRQDHSAQERTKSMLLASHSSSAIALPLREQITQIINTLTQQQSLAISEAETNILSAIQRYRLTTKNLANTIGQPPDQILAIVQRLWGKGYIDYLTAPLIYTAFPGLRNPHYRQQRVQPDAYLTLTAKGYFYLNPIVQFYKPQIPA